MKITKTVSKTVESKEVLSVICDFCAKDIHNQIRKDLEKEIIDTYDWEGCGYGPSAYATIEMRLSNSFPECGSDKEFKLDICANCFKVEILDRAKNFTVTESDW